MDFELSPKAQDYRDRLQDFMDSRVFPAEAEYEAYRREKGRDDHTLPPVVEELKAEARSRGLWNLFLPDVSGLTNLEYAPLAELTGWSSHIAPEAINCDAPNTGNMEVLHMFGTPEQKSEWLQPLMEGQIRSAFAMTEPDVASSDATNISTRIERDGDDYVINGRKWWTTGINDPRCKIMILMGKTDPSASPHRQQSMILVPVDTPGVEVVRALPVFGYQDQSRRARCGWRCSWRPRRRRRARSSRTPSGSRPRAAAAATGPSAPGCRTCAAPPCSRCSGRRS